MSKLKILHINTLDSLGGAAQVANDLIHHLDADCHLVVMKKTSDDERVIQLPKNALDYFFRFLSKVMWKLGQQKSLRAFLSLDNEANYTFAKLKQLKEYQEADIIHLHNIHGGFFDFNALVEIAKEKKIVWTLHDMWAITGGEAYTFGNENYKKGIGYTPYISNYPLLNPLIDRRHFFLKKKKEIYKEIHEALTVVVVSKWLENCFRQSFVYNLGIDLRRIHNGIDTSLFTGTPLRDWPKPRILFFKANNPFKGEQLFLDILGKIQHDFELIVVGERLKRKIKYKHIKYVGDREMLNALYNQVDILVFPSLAENFPLTVLEAMACRVCVIASDTGGIPEMLDN